MFHFDPALVALIVGIFIVEFLVTGTRYSVPVAMAYAFFMRSPSKLYPDLSQNSFYAPCDGVLTSVTRDANHTKFSIFLNLFDNHTQYFPTDSVLVDATFYTGDFHVASTPSSIYNQRVVNKLVAASAYAYTLTQYTGLIARRIDTIATTGVPCQAGERLGFIKLGSRVEIVVPSSWIQSSTFPISDKLILPVKAMQTVLFTKKQ